MNIEELTKSQIFLLTVLTSFVTSMATGIVTVALMDQAPPTITQSVSRVIQATVEPKPAAKNAQPVAAAVAAPLQAPQEELPQEPTLSEVIQRFLPSVVRLYDDKGVTLIGIGVVLDGQGTVVADATSFTSPYRPLIIDFGSGARLEAKIVAQNNDHHLVFAVPAAASSTLPSSPASLSKDPLALGQTVVAVSGKTEPRIASGLVAALSGGTTAVVETDIDTSALAKVLPIINMQGVVVGLSTTGLPNGSFIPASVVAADYETAFVAASASSEGLKKGKK